MLSNSQYLEKDFLLVGILWIDQQQFGLVLSYILSRPCASNLCIFFIHGLGEDFNLFSHLSN